MARKPIDITNLSEEELDRLQVEPDGRAFRRHVGAERWWIGSIIVCTLILLIMGLRLMARGSEETREQIESHQDDATRITGEAITSGR